MLTNLRRLREELGISQQVLANAIGVSQQSINKYENHKIEPDIDTLIRIADFFETSVDFVVGHTDIRRRVEPVCSYELNIREQNLVDLYRRLTPAQREAILGVMESYDK